MDDSLKKLEGALGVKVISSANKFSRRNKVQLIEAVSGANIKQLYVIKEHLHTSAANEVFILKTLRQQGFSVPEVLWYDNSVIIMPYIRGQLLADVLESSDRGEQLWIDELAQWLFKLHRLMRSNNRLGLCMSDLNLRNFIFDGQKIYGLDFESLCFFPPERDLGVLCAFILNNDPMFTNWKYDLCRSLLSSYEALSLSKGKSEISYSSVWFYLIEEMQAAAKRREKQRQVLNTHIEQLSYSRLFRQD